MNNLNGCDRFFLQPTSTNLSFTERIVPQDTHVELWVMREWVLWSQMENGEVSARHTDITLYPLLHLFKVTFGVRHRSRLVEKRGIALHIPMKSSPAGHGNTLLVPFEYHLWESSHIAVYPGPSPLFSLQAKAFLFSSTSSASAISRLDASHCVRASH
jgi:hypothetical protein